MDRLYAMRVFVRAMDGGSFAAAAKYLGISPATVTRAMDRLESQLGARLLHRTTRRLVLTTIGEDYLERSRRILAKVDALNALVDGSNQEPSGKLRILAPGSFATRTLLARLRTFRDRYPLVTLELTTGDCHVGADRDYDVSIQMVGGRCRLGDGFASRRLTSSDVIPCVSPSKLYSDGALHRPEELAERDCLLYSGCEGTAWRFSRPQPAPECIDVDPRQILKSGDVNALLAGANDSMGYVQLPSFVVGEALQAKKLVRLLPQWHVFTYDVHAAVPDHDHVPAKSRALVEFLAQSFDNGERDFWLGRHPPQRLVSA